MPIHFGTDGWRAIMGKEYTTENVRICAQGTAEMMTSTGMGSRKLIIGYDTRLESESFARTVAEVISANGIPTLLSDRATPTPVISYNLVNKYAGGGVVITASHNPPEWNGFKFKPDYGGSASPAIVENLESHINKVAISGQINHLPIEEGIDRGIVEFFDPEPTYIKHLARLVDLESIRHSGLKIVVDPMYGAGMGYFQKLISGGQTSITEIHGVRNPKFPGMTQPEPLAHNLGDLMTIVKSQKADIGLATDGDADRLGIVDSDGHFITTLQSYALLCLYQLEILGKRGPLVRSITMTSMIDKLGEKYEVPVFETPVGFKYLGPVMIRENALAAGEESGGYAFRGHIPERDGILSGLMILDMMVKTGTSISKLLDRLLEIVGPHHYDRWDLTLREDQKSTVIKRLQTAQPKYIGGRTVRLIDKKDGFRFLLSGGYWTLIRFSGTEPLMRIYAEGESPEEVVSILNQVRSMTRI